jgi:hypothetical protein
MRAVLPIMILVALYVAAAIFAPDADLGLLYFGFGRDDDNTNV